MLTEDYALAALVGALRILRYLAERRRALVVAQDESQDWVLMQHCND